MKERPILFSAPMVQAILKSQKTQTRRIITPQPSYIMESQCRNYQPGLVDRHGELYPGPEVYGFCNEEHGWKSPYGQPGDRLWVRETWSVDAISMYPCPQVWYRADNSIDPKAGHVCPKKSVGRYADCLACWEEREGRKFKWMPSIFMKRHHSRLSLEVVNVRVERLHEITEADAIAEGIGHNDVDAAVVDYASLWDRIHGAGSWDANPFVWVVEFKRVEVKA
jgi:hypothetical protein